jgi:hypothetical protein
MVGRVEKLRGDPDLSTRGGELAGIASKVCYYLPRKANGTMSALLRSCSSCSQS